VSQRLLELTGDSALAGYQTKSPKRVVEMVQALYETLQILGITYLTVPSSFEKTGQKVRLPEVLLRELMGNCIDVSVLISACLEQMGLHPLLVIVEGHAFPGVWLIDDGFPEGEVYDAARLRNGRALDQLLFLDSSALTVQPRLPLTRAVAVAEAALENDARFGFAIDVRVARRNGYRPLPLRVDGPLTSPVSAEDKPAGDGSLAARLLDEATLQGPVSPEQAAQFPPREQRRAPVDGA